MWHVTSNMCSVFLWAFHEGRWVMALIGDAKQADKKWNWTNWTGGNGLVMLLWSLVDVEIYLMYFCSWQLLTVAIWLIQPMARLITLLEHYWDRMPPTVVTQATTWWEIVLALVKQKESGLGVHLPVRVCYYTLCVCGPFASVLRFLRCDYTLYS